MAESQLDTIAPAFARYLKLFRRCFTNKNNRNHFSHYCQGLIAKLPRKTVEPIALAAGTAVRTLQEFLVTNHWDHDAVRDQLHRHVQRQLRRMPDEPLGTIGLIDETSCLKKGDKTPGVQRKRSASGRLVSSFMLEGFLLGYLARNRLLHPPTLPNAGGSTVSNSSVRDCASRLIAEETNSRLAGSSFNDVNSSSLTTRPQRRAMEMDRDSVIMAVSCRGCRFGNISRRTAICRRTEIFRGLL